MGPNSETATSTSSKVSSGPSWPMKLAKNTVEFEDFWALNMSDLMQDEKFSQSTQIAQVYTDNHISYIIYIYIYHIDMSS